MTDKDPNNVSRRKVLAGVAGAAAGLAGCASDVGTDDPDDTVVRSDKGVEIRSLEVVSSGDRNCYHEYWGTVANTTNDTIDDLHIQLTLLNESGRVLAEFPVQFQNLDAGESLEFNLENGPEKNGCWSSTNAEDYQVSVDY